jgi:hypothetical protein
MQKVQEVEPIKSTMLTRLMVLDTKSPPLITAVTTKLKKVQEDEFIKSTMLTRMMVLDKPSPMTTAEPLDPNVTTDAAPPTKVISEASMETTLTPTAAKRNPAGDKSEEAKEEPDSKDIVTTHVVTQEQNRKIPNNNNNQAAQVQGTHSKIGASLTDDDDAFTERAVPFDPDPIGPICDDTKVP